MKATRRHINWRSPHPTLPEEFDVLLMDDGFISVTPARAIPEDVYFVDVSGDDTTIAGIRSFGDVVVPSAFLESMALGPARQSSRLALSDCFRGLNLGMFMWGKKSTIKDVMAETTESACDQTKIVLNEGDVLACVAADAYGKIYCFDEAGNEIVGWTFMNRGRLHDLKNYYAFCGVLSADKSKFTVHCEWNIPHNMPVGPPYDRRIAGFIGLDFAPPALDWTSCKEPIMVRFDGKMPMVISAQ